MRRKRSVGWKLFTGKRASQWKGSSHREEIHSEDGTSYYEKSFPVWKVRFTVVRELVDIEKGYF